MLEKAGFTVSVATGSYSDEYAEGEVMSQTPNGGKLGKGETVTITISKGQDPVESRHIPNVVGMTQSQAESAQATPSPLRLLYDPAITSKAASLVLIEQSITGTGKKGKTVIIKVSNGPASSKPATETAAPAATPATAAILAATPATSAILATAAEMAAPA